MSLDDRSQARVLALQAMCLFDSLGDRFGESELEAFLHDPVNYHDLGWDERPRQKALAKARELADGAWRERDRTDQLLREHVPDWSVERMQPVDRNILRLGLFELLEQRGAPYQVVINEAVELARHFGGQESAAFVNGVLDGVRKATDLWAAAPTAVDAPRHSVAKRYDGAQAESSEQTS